MGRPGKALMGGPVASAMGPGVVLAVDEGTTGVTALVLDAAGGVVGRAYREVGQAYPRPGWVEQDAAAMLEAVVWTGRAALRTAKAEPRDVVAVGLANQRETTVLWDRDTGAPAAPAIVWQDRRTAPRCADLRPQWAAKIRRRTGLVLDPYFSATKLEWLLRDGPGNDRLLQKAREGRLAAGTVDAWLLHQLTGQHATDPTNASRTMLWDIHKGAWDDELLELFGVPERLLPEVRPSSGDFGTTEAFGHPMPVLGVAGDQQAALFGQACTKAGEAKSTYGTGCFLLQHTGGDAIRSRHGLLTTRAASTGRAAQFALEGSVFSAGSAIQWLRDQLALLRAAPEADALAEQVPDAGGVMVVPAFTGLGAPHWDPDARGAVLGLSRGSDRRHLARAVLEAIAFQATEVMAAMQKDSQLPIPRLRVDGGAAQSAPMLQFQADLLQRPVVRPANLETTAMGAACLAGLAAGAWKLADLRKPRAGDAVVAPTMAAAAAKRRMAQWRKAVAAVRAYGAGA
ncbi:MAG: glycerol kinase [Thermoplasmata archaeon]|jgi:glycerol kinase|nr:glycerol kinase [Thermoplasmata archaeon]